ncbi:hypothetical protein CAOG_05217 [Capsaspora owczarzaki ATCC 30864]|uniref:MYND-type domain-containing protein n=1 Tax=Capsaspora owczarzaki (strain ATCC 30864) TaxID=595528 RepID=A0A0D2UHM0_CAPO3|nr:hypothetical protein CAOG_05217 [Capsaspora owczarzaki ATCC 30864]KJE94591.1 hypothetical protein CAOG_005217 [Capsaspora owczarzaki ATCC 30864]|eukprot:XP_004346902.1 hypothetical protein CAOG_05217 [Capsaspora owczarzaki ATCC 30864]
MSSTTTTTTTTTADSSAPTKHKLCAVCQKLPTEVKRCGKCFKTYYCSRECQVKDWPRHKTECNSAIHINTSATGSASGSNSGEQAEETKKLQQTAAPAQLFTPQAVTGADIYTLFNLPVGDPKILQFVIYLVHLNKTNGAPITGQEQYHAPVPTIARFPGSDYHNYPVLGLSLCFEKNLLTAVHVYCEAVSGYTGYCGPLPHGISLKDNNVDIVKRLGEPTVKGGKVVNVWIAYEELGMQVDFSTKDWNDLDNKISSVALYAPR